MDPSDPNPHQSEPDLADLDPGPFSERGLRILKFAVVFMAILLVVGFMVVVVTIAFRAVELGEAEPDLEAEPPAHGFSRLDVEVEPDTLISQIELDGNRMAVHVTKDKADEILIIDIRSGELIGRVKLIEKPAQ